ncbi:N-acetyltransferase, partial [Escherichia coli]|nr:N-acetyltransferase [Escherichia coli]EFO3822281.1 N-acetyltransferase [Escherichia coli]
MENLKYIPFNQVDFSDVFFDSLKSDYAHGFIDWFHSKC